MKLAHWAIVAIVFWILTVLSGLWFMRIHVELWDNSMNSILISQEEFRTLNIRGILLFLSSIAFVVTFTYTTVCYVKQANHPKLNV